MLGSTHFGCGFNIDDENVVNLMDNLVVPMLNHWCRKRQEYLYMCFESI